MLHDTLSAQGKPLPLVSVIMPVYNTQDFVAISIQSVLDQTYPNFELICVDDGSSDESANIIRSFAAKDRRVRLIQIENHGQGYVRNMAVRDEAKGKYIQFLDADDYLEPVTLDVAVARAEKDDSDLVIYDWLYFEPVGQTPNYVNKDTLFSKTVLEGEECLRLLEISPFFTVNKLYRKSFLSDNGVVYGEDYIYEDIPFWVKVALNAKKVSTLHSPLYRVTINKSSTTKTNLGTSKHCDGFVLAAEEVTRDFTKTPATNEARYNVLLYLIQKFGYYYTVRIPEELKKSFIKGFVDAISPLEVEDLGRDKYLTSYLEKGVFKEKKYSTFGRLIDFYYTKKPKLKSFYTKVKDKCKNLLKKIINKFSKKKKAEKTLWQKYIGYTKQPLYEDVILFAGFDYRYTGNSRYLFEEMIRSGTKKKIFFATTDVRVPLQYRIAPGSDRFNRFMARSKTVIFESWIPLRFVKRPNANWVQLWHGTPLKKMLFDANEKSIIEHNPEQKLNKYKDMRRWDYLLIDNPEIGSYFETSFLFPKQRLLEYGYPRVKYLLENRGNEYYREKLRENYGFPADKKIVLYLPTWRDYNYQTEDSDFDLSYLLPPDLLQEKLGDDYLVVYKDHVFLSKSELVTYKNHDGAETQELLLVADMLVTDYSSVMFDACAIDVPVVLYCSDLERNEEERGMYEGMWSDISPLMYRDIDGVVEAIRDYKHTDVCRTIREKYCYKCTESGSLADFILKL